MSSAEIVTRGPEEIAAVTRALQRRFPGALVWFGVHTWHWWAFVPGGQWGFLLEGITPEQLEWKLGEVFGYSPGPQGCPALTLGQTCPSVGARAS